VEPALLGRRPPRRTRHQGASPLRVRRESAPPLLHRGVFFEKAIYTALFFFWTMVAI
jgi:hypothetical protein